MSFRPIVFGILLVMFFASSAHEQDQTAPKSNTQQPAPDPWTPAQTVEPAALAKEIAASNATSKPAIACVGFRVLYEGGHIPGASYHGPARTDEGLADLKKWADGLPRTTNIVLYCGCCPLTHCPNLRPAFAALRDMGFTHLRAVIMPTNFATDWADRGYPVEKGN
jgi:rhodanese-related sulfurtransferase